MNDDELDTMVEVFTKGLVLDKEQLRTISALCRDVERTTRHKCVSVAYDLVNKINNLR